MTARPGVLVAAHGVGRRYARRVALAPLDLEVRAGERVALLGPNGAGKTTLLTLLAGAAEADRGNGRARVRAYRLGAAAPRLYRKLTARENLRLFAELERLERPHDEAERLLGQVDLLDAADRPAQDLSVGNVQRLNVAIGLVADPAVVFLDEPTASLDPRQRARLWQLLRGVTGRGGAGSSRRRTSRRRTPRRTGWSCCRRGGSSSGAQEAFWERAGVENTSTGAFERAFVRFLEIQSAAR